MIDALRKYDSDDATIVAAGIVGVFCILLAVWGLITEPARQAQRIQRESDYCQTMLVYVDQVRMDDNYGCMVRMENWSGWISLEKWEALYVDDPADVYADKKPVTFGGGGGESGGGYGYGLKVGEGLKLCLNWNGVCVGP